MSRAIEITQKFLECRDIASKMMTADEYRRQTGEIRQMLRDGIGLKQVPVVVVAHKLVEFAVDNGDDWLAVVIMAATADEIEGK
jgi:hypothetical protein